MPRPIILDDAEHALMDVLKGSSLEPGGTLAKSDLVAEARPGFGDERLLTAIASLADKGVVKALDGDRLQVTDKGREMISLEAAASTASVEPSGGL